MPETYGAHECRAYFVVESTYGQTPTNPTMNGILAESIESSISPNLIKVRAIGTRDLQNIRRGLRQPTLKIGHLIPSGFCDYLIQYAKTLQSLSVEVLYYKGDFSSPTNVISLLYTGMRIDKVTVKGSIDDIIRADVELVGQNLTVGTSKIGTTYNDQYGLNSNVLTSEWCLVRRGSASGENLTNIERVTDWQVTINNNLKPVPVVRGTNSYLLKYLQPCHRELGGELTFEFEDKSEFEDVINDSEFSLQFYMGYGYYLLFTYCKWDEVKTPTKIEDLVSLKARFTARNLTTN